MLAVLARRLLFALTAAVLALASMFIAPAPAMAHALLVDTMPGNWQVIESSPAEISLRFSEPVDAGLAEIRLLGPHGDAVEGLPVPTHPDGRGESLSIKVPGSLATGTHTVAYRVVSADSHPVHGAFMFSVGEPTPGAAPASAAMPEVSGLTAVANGVVRWIGYAGLILLLGTAFFVTACWPGQGRRTGVRRLLWSGWAAVLAATVLGFLIYGPYTAGRPLSTVVDPELIASTVTSRMGVLLLIRSVLLAGVAIVLIRWLKPSETGETEDTAEQRAPSPHEVLAAGVALSVTWSLATHSAAGHLIALALAADIVHLCAMSIWIGGLPVLAGVLLRSGDVPGMRTAIPRFSRTAAVCVVLLVVTGIFQAWRGVGTPSALFGTAYGTVLIGKLTLVAVLIGLGALARRWVKRQYGGPVVTVPDKRRARRGPPLEEITRFRRSIGVEAGTAVLVLGLTTALVGVEPAVAEVAREQESARTPAYTGPVSTVVPFDAGGATGRGQLAVEFGPGRIGANEVHLAVLDAASAPREVPEVRAALRLPEKALGPLPVRVEPAGPGHYIATSAMITMPGQWELELIIRISEFDQATVRVPVGIR